MDFYISDVLFPQKIKGQAGCMPLMSCCYLIETTEASMQRHPCRGIRAEASVQRHPCRGIRAEASMLEIEFEWFESCLH